MYSFEQLLRRFCNSCMDALRLIASLLASGLELFQNWCSPHSFLFVVVGSFFLCRCATFAVCKWIFSLSSQDSGRVFPQPRQNFTHGSYCAVHSVIHSSLSYKITWSTLLCMYNSTSGKRHNCNKKAPRISSHIWQELSGDNIVHFAAGNT